MDAANIVFVMNVEVVGVSTCDCVELRLKSGQYLRAEAVLVSSGRCGQTGALGLDRIGVKTNDRGQIEVDDYYQTAVPHVYAAGDVIGNPSLASTSMEQ